MKHILYDLHIVEEKAEKEAFLAALHAAQEPVVVSFLNAHALNLASKDEAFAGHLLASNYLLRDGVGVALLLRLLGLKKGLNMNGTDLTPQIIRSFKGKRVALFGTQEPWLSRAAQLIEERGVSVIHQMDGFQSSESYCRAIQQNPVDLVILAMGMPRQESLSMDLAKAVNGPVVIVNGGAILDFMAERFPRAPLIWRKMRAEWLFRLIQEPRRLSNRYIFGGFAFLFLALRVFVSHHLLTKA